ncbi:hypothetical protein M422DRAFT_129154, partial [Sphaerobolus stellatus SS14]
LQSGCIGKVSIRLPWSTILTDPVELSVSSLSLTFACTPKRRNGAQARTTDDVAASVGSLAESFLHEELSTGESEDLRRSLHLDVMPSQRHPGLMDPFLSTEELDADGGEGYFYEEKDTSAEGVSLIAVLLERLLGKVKFDGSDIKIRLVLPDQVELSSYIGEISYKTESPDTLSDR